MYIYFKYVKRTFKQQIFAYKQVVRLWEMDFGKGKFRSSEKSNNVSPENLVVKTITMKILFSFL